MAVSDETKQVIEEAAEIAAEAAAVLNIAFRGKGFSPRESFQLTRQFLYDTARDAGA